MTTENHLLDPHMGVTGDPGKGGKVKWLTSVALRDNGTEDLKTSSKQGVLLYVPYLTIFTTSGYFIG